eukprot:1472455-Pyramimonas_sp.AAC.3
MATTTATWTTAAPSFSTTNDDCRKRLSSGSVMHLAKHVLHITVTTKNMGNTPLVCAGGELPAPFTAHSSMVKAQYMLGSIQSNAKPTHMQD